MTQIYELTKDYVEQYDLNNHDWVIFAHKCTQKEFLQSQEGFYYAVKAFPRILSKLACEIKSSNARKFIIENLWEEHGQGTDKKFHTTTYHEYLKSLGLSKTEKEISHQPWVEDWIKLVLNKNYPEEYYAMYIAGIEFIYARISFFITNLIKKYNLLCEQSHYEKHSVLDYEHAKELIATSLLIQKENGTSLDEEMMKYFALGIYEFMQLYEKMVLLTEKDAQRIAMEDHAFYYGREDTTINKKFLKNWHKENNKNAEVLMICSGGENAIDLLSMQEGNNIVLLDINPHQLDIALKKINCIKMNGDLTQDLLIFNKGKFEKLFKFLRNSLTHEELEEIAKRDIATLKKLKWVCNNVFSNKILEIVFTENATKYSNESFAAHFYNLLKKQIQLYFKNNPDDSNIGSIFFNKSPINYKVNINSESKINFYNGSFINYFDENNKNFDLIDLSNISDWMPFNEMKIIVAQAYEHLNSGGVIVGRKLLGDYNWIDLQKDLNKSNITKVKDSTDFYRECVLIKKDSIW